MKTKFKETEIGLIPEDWDVIELGLIGKICMCKRIFKNETNPIGEIPFYKIKTFGKNPDAFISKELFLKYKEKYSFPKKGAILLSTSGTIGRTMVFNGKPAYFQDSNIVWLDHNESKLDNKFLYYIYKTIHWITEGSTIKRLYNSNIEQTKISLPLLSEQKLISKILSDLDSKIELNQNMNKTLEEIGKAIFKHWFIDFEFPNEEGKPYKSSGGEMVYNEELGKEIPKYWKLEIIDNVVTVKGGSTPDTTNNEYWFNGSINWCTPKDLSNLNSPILLDTDKKITEKGLATISSGLLPVGTLLLSSRAPIGYLAISEIPVSINQGFIAILCNKILSKYFMLFWLQHNMIQIESRAQGTTFQEINKTNFRNIPILTPTQKILNHFDNLLHTFYYSMVKNQKEINIISQMRDSLLPKLMSGKIRVPVEAN